jgi:two-component system, sensor histidine kinase and response regulator
MPPGDRMEILLVEDNELNLAVTMHTLTRSGHQVTVARNGRLALEMTGVKTYDLVLMDVQMPEMNGLQASQLIRTREQAAVAGARLLILAMTAREAQGDAVTCLAAGMDGYLAKPLRISAMWAEIDRVRGTERPADPASPPTLDPALDLRALLEETGADRVLLARLVAIYREETPAVLARLQRALSALEVGVDDDASEELNQAAHALKSMLGHWQRRGRAFDAAGRLEEIGRQGGLSGRPDEARRVYDQLRTGLQVVDQQLEGVLEAIGEEGTRLESPDRR